MTASSETTLPEQGPVRRTVRFGVGPEWSPHQLALAAVSTLGAALFLLSLHLAAGGFEGIFWLLLVVPATTMSFAGSGGPLAFWSVLLFGWFHLSPAGSFTWWSVPAAAGLLASHAANAMSAAAPPAATFAVGSVTRWARCVGVAFAAAVVVAGGAAALSGRGLGASPAAYGLGLAGVALGVWLLRRNPPRPRD